MCLLVFFFFKQKTAYEMRISDWSSDVCSSDLNALTYLQGVFLPVVPKLYARWEAELGRRPASFLRVGSWIGGDRDGNPFVTAETLRLATGRNAAAVLGHYLNAVHALGAELSVSSALAPVPAAVEALAELGRAHV